MFAAVECQPHEGTPMPTMAQRVLARLVSKLGERGAVSYLDISETLLKAYLEGLRPVPDRIWLRAVDAISDEAGGIPKVGKPRNKEDDKPA